MKLAMMEAHLQNEKNVYDSCWMYQTLLVIVKLVLL